MIAQLAQYLYKTVKLACKNVLSNVREYACFFAAVFIIQVFFTSLSMVLFNNDKTEWTRVCEEYSYHAVLYDLNETQKVMLENGRDTGLIVSGNDDVYDIVRMVEHYDFFDDTYSYDMYFNYKGSTVDQIAKSRDRFDTRLLKDIYKMNDTDQHPTLRHSPRLTFSSSNMGYNRAFYAVATVLVAALSVFLLVMLYNIRINHYKFIYGIYMTFGADFGKLFETAFFEMFVISVITYLPAVGASTLISYLIIHLHGLPYYFSFPAAALTALYALIVLLISVSLPMRTVASRPPMTLLVSQDNSNLVSSPRRSLNIFGTKFPFQYEVFSTWRFRRYNLRLLVSAVLFTSLFICGLFLSEFTGVMLSEEKPQFTVDLSPTNITYDDFMRDELYAIDGVTFVSKSNTTHAVSEVSHMRVNAESTLPNSNFVVPGKDDDKMYRMSSDVEYRTLDADVAAELEARGYDYDGDLYSPLRDDRYVVLSDSIMNTRRLDLKVGDTVDFATLVRFTQAIDSGVYGKALLRQQLESAEFDYHEFTVGAVIHDMPSILLPVYFSENAYKEVTGNDVNYFNREIYVDGSLDVVETTRIEDELRQWAVDYGGAKVTNTHANHRRTVDDDKQFDKIFTLVASLLLTISPMIWFFSQALYYIKRENEFTILESLGARGSDIRKLYIFGGIFMGTLAFLFCIILGYALSYGLYLILNIEVPYWTQTWVRFAFHMPWYAITLSIIMSVSCGFLSAYLPYKLNARKRSKTLAVDTLSGDSE